MKNKGKIRYAVVGLGHIAQAAVLPAFVHASANSELTALVSGDGEKLKELGDKYKINYRFTYDEYEKCLTSGTVDAVYIALPNNMHHDFTLRAAKAGVHVLCEKPLAVTEHECDEMIRACSQHNVKLMTAYRLHFEKANLEAIAVVQSGNLGVPRIFNSVFTLQVRPGDIRVQGELGGGTLYDIGIYCINAARYLFKDEPIEVYSYSEKGRDKRFTEVDEMSAGILRFSDGQLASFTTSFATPSVDSYTVVGTKGALQMENAYGYKGEKKMITNISGKKDTKLFSSHDQFAPELIYFSDCILNGIQPEPSGMEGLIDVHIVEALYESAALGRPVPIDQFRKNKRPNIGQVIQRSPVKEKELVHTESPSL